MAGEIKFLWENIKFHTAAAMEYRFNFLFQSGSMLLNDILLVIFWWILFNNFETMNGYIYKDILLLISIVSGAIGISRLIFGNANNLYKTIAEGELDYYLVLPKSVLLNSIIKMNYMGAGDAIFGITMGIILLPIKQYILFLFLMTLSVIVFTSYLIIASSASFYVGQGKAIASHLEIGLIVTASYPWALFEGTSRFLLLTILPAGFVGGIPIELIKNFSRNWFIGYIGFTILIATIAYTIFYKGLKKYESGSLIVTRG